jgi:hypothetical protein
MINNKKNNITGFLPKCIYSKNNNFSYHNTNIYTKDFNNNNNNYQNINNYISTIDEIDETIDNKNFHGKTVLNISDLQTNSKAKSTTDLTSDTTLDPTSDFTPNTISEITAETTAEITTEITAETTETKSDSILVSTNDSIENTQTDLKSDLKSDLTIESTTEYKQLVNKHPEDDNVDVSDFHLINNIDNEFFRNINARSISPMNNRFLIPILNNLYNNLRHCIYNSDYILICCDQLNIDLFKISEYTGLNDNKHKMFKIGDCIINYTPIIDVKTDTFDKVFTDKLCCLFNKITLWPEKLGKIKSNYIVFMKNKYEGNMNKGKYDEQIIKKPFALWIGNIDEDIFHQQHGVYIENENIAETYANHFCELLEFVQKFYQ